MNISIICALTKNNIIGKGNKLLWHLPDDLKRFKQITTGHYIIMGRKTFESLGGKALPNRTSVVITRQENYQADNCIVVNSLEKAIEVTKHDNEVFILGGGQIYSKALSIANKMYLTILHTELEGDTYFPEFNKNKWSETLNEEHKVDNKHAYSFSYVNYKKIEN